MKPFKTCVTQERGEGRSTKKVIKSDAGGGGGGGGLQPKNVIALTQNNEIL